MRCCPSRCAALLILLAAACASPAAAQPAIEGYANYETYAARLKALDASELVAVSSLGRTLGGREVFLVTISSGDPLAKPAILVVGNVEATHLVGSELAERVAGRLVGPNADADATKKLLERLTIYVIPRPNPDASEHFFNRPSVERSGNDRPSDDDRDGQVDEDPVQDLNGDGLITMIRVEDENGDYLPHPADPRVMIKADPLKNERGRYRLYSEGRDDDQDDEFNEDGPGGVSFNRNFPHRYPYFEPLAGPHQVSEIESRAVADFAFAHPNIALVLAFTPEDNLLEPWKPNQGGASSREKPAILASDAEHVNYLAEQYRQILGAKDAPAAPAAAGSFSEWAYFQYGRWSLAARGWWIPKVAAKTDEPATPADEPGKQSSSEPAGDAQPDAAKSASGERKAKSAEKEKRGADELNALAWFKREGIEGFVAWQAVEHPDFPGKKVEVGGFKPYLRLNPPAKELDPLADKHFQFLLKLADTMPRVKIAAVEVTPLGSGVFRLLARVVNTGYLPTMAAMGKTTDEAYPLRIKIDLPAGAKLLTGHARSRLEVLAGNGGKTEHVWLVLAPEPGVTKAEISVTSPCVGSDTKSVEL